MEIQKDRYNSVQKHCQIDIVCLVGKASSNLLLDDIHDSRLSDRRQVTKLIALACNDLAHDATHDLARTSLRHIRDDVDLLGGSEGTDDLSDLQRELLD